MGLMGTLFGKAAKSSSGNTAAPWINSTFQGPAASGIGGINALAGALDGGFDEYADNAGWDFQLGEGLDGITGSQAARGFLRSGDTGKDYVRYGTNLKSQFYDNYLGQLGNLGQLGLGAGQLVSGAGQQSTEKGATSGALGKIGKTVGGIASIFSDRRLKTDIEKIGEARNGLPWYQFRYVWDAPDAPLREGLMSDDVRALRPEAVIVDGSGFDRVIYPVAMEA